MSSPFARMRLGAAVVLAFVCGLVFASALDFTRFGYAQGAAPASSTLRPMTDASNAFVAIAEQVTPAVVSISTTREARRTAQPRLRGRVPPGFEDLLNQLDPNQRPEPVSADGSGFIVSRDGYILTNNHVVGDADRVTVSLADHRQFEARVIGGDSTTDVAVIKIEGSNLPSVELGEDSTTRVGEWVLAIGNPLGLDFTVTAGIVSAKGRSNTDLPGLLGRENRFAISDFIQTDAAINPGNSGGPLVNSRGKVIGINSAIASRTGFYSGYGFAIPVSLARNVMEDIIKHGRVRAPILGISIVEVAPEDAEVAGLKTIAGVLVAGFSPPEGSAAERAGIQPNDVIVRIDGRPVDRVSTLQRIVREHEPGESVSVEVMRYGTRRTFQVKLAERAADSATRLARATPAPAPAAPVGESPMLGVTLEAITPEFARQANLPQAERGVRVIDVTSSGPARGKLFPGGDVITDIVYPQPARKVRTPAELQQALARLAPGDVVSLRVYSALEPIGPRIVNVRLGQK
jgi:serine protease Do